MPGYDKEPDMRSLGPRYPDAKRRAKALRTRQNNNGEYRQNPWTDVDVFFDLIRPK